MTMPFHYHWQEPHNLALSPLIKNILLSPLPTTPRLKQISQGHLQIVVCQQGWNRATDEEAACLEINAGTKIWQRVVKLRDQKQVWMFARAIVPAAHMQGEWRGLRRLGNRSLGSWLQSKTAWNRSTFKVAETEGHWARRSLFTATTQGKRFLLLSEVFTRAAIQALAQLDISEVDH